MIKIRLFCDTSISTRELIDNMRKAARNKNLEVDIEAYPKEQIFKNLEIMNIALLGPELTYEFPKVKAIFEKKQIPIDVIPGPDYSDLNGFAVLELALKLYDK
ncbi:PTS sugar transporter subunit IIB [Clostridium vincentii]|uniref:Lichenan-specific phosphotransferase enzyme IIB component n=1 Tax=Clostridium vincentii TaxID=52704 RepID=A0A2T0BCF5_9CLOT|nr:PTS sugar transporter subunit IIB [Clostridium vincentii]PRR81586.1 Lichenan-specific phosphotransferase enzyme IIB component [Clostridium vincentii]